jgi:hypothetical protein
MIEKEGEREQKRESKIVSVYVCEDITRVVIINL